ncbi:MAG: YetF domain-containing protein [Patescibacteria group bacterium]
MDVIQSELVRMFLGTQPPLFLLEVVFRTVVMYSYMLFAARFLGKRGTGQLTVFDFIVVILLGSAVGDPMFYDDVPLLHGIIVITIVVLVERALNHFTNRNVKLEEFIESTPALLVKDGVILHEALAKEAISLPELMMELRDKGIRNTGEVECAYLEPSGRMSVFTVAEGKETFGEPTFPKE